MVVVGDDGEPVVVRNGPVLDDGSPMPTRYWLVGRRQRLAVDRLESAGGVTAARSTVDPEELARAHQAYAAERDAAVPAGWQGPRPHGGVGGTAQGVKCLHAHYAYWLAGGADPVGRWVAEQLAAGPGPEPPSGNLAAVDCGTLSTRLLVATPAGQVLAREARITGLGRGVDASRRLDDDAMDEVLAVLRDYRAVMDQHEVAAVDMVGTSALRDAANRDVFLVRAAGAVGTELRLLSGEEEARLSFLGATAELGAAPAPWLVVDIGGGSTELAVGPEPFAARSLDFGCVRVAERFLHHDPPAPDELRRAREQVTAELRRACADQPALERARGMIGLAGTVSALALYDQGLAAYDRARVHHYRLRAAAVDAALTALAAVPARRRAGLPGIEARRAGPVVAGTLVLSAVMGHFGFSECLVSEADILDGLVGELRRSAEGGGGAG